MVTTPKIVFLPRKASDPEANMTGTPSAAALGRLLLTLGGLCSHVTMSVYGGNV